MKNEGRIELTAWSGLRDLCTRFEPGHTALPEESPRKIS